MIQPELTCATAGCSLHPESPEGGVFTLCDQCIEKYVKPSSNE